MEASQHHLLRTKQNKYLDQTNLEAIGHSKTCLVSTVYMEKEGIAFTPSTSSTSPTLVRVLAKHFLVEMIGKESKKGERRKEYRKSKQTKFNYGGTPTSRNEILHTSTVFLVSFSHLSAASGQSSAKPGLEGGICFFRRLHLLFRIPPDYQLYFFNFYLLPIVNSYNICCNRLISTFPKPK